MIIPSAILISEDKLSSVHVLLYTTALERDYKITVTLNIHAMAFKKTNHRQRSRLQDR
jgi:hypothetical protein